MRGWVYVSAEGGLTDGQPTLLGKLSWSGAHDNDTLMPEVLWGIGFLIVLQVGWVGCEVGIGMGMDSSRISDAESHGICPWISTGLCAESQLPSIISLKVGRSSLLLASCVSSLEDGLELGGMVGE